MMLITCIPMYTESNMHVFITAIQKRFKRWDRRVALSKRQQLVVITLILTLGLVMTQMVSTDLRYIFVVILSFLAYGLSAFGLREDLKGIEWITLLTLPTFFTGAIALFYFLLPVRWLTRVPVAVLYALGMYALLLTENIYNVAANRTIGLLRAAHSVGFLLTLVTYFLLVQTALSFRFPFYISTLVIGLVSFFLVLQCLWAMELEVKLSTRLVQISIATALALIQLSWALTFWPVKLTILSLFLTTCFYSMVGMAQQYLVERLYKKTIVEFFVVSFIVFLLMILTTHWRGNY